MRNDFKLKMIKTVHTIIWVMFNIVIFYMLYAVFVNKIDQWLWMGYGLFVLEGITLSINKFACPLTAMARKYSGSREPNFDIYLPAWLARHNKLIYSAILFVIILLTIYQLLNTS